MLFLFLAVSKPSSLYLLGVVGFAQLIMIQFVAVTTRPTAILVLWIWKCVEEGHLDFRPRLPRNTQASVENSPYNEHGITYTNDNLVQNIYHHHIDKNIESIPTTI